MRDLGPRPLRASSLTKMPPLDFLAFRGRVAEVLGSLRQGKSARLSQGVSQLGQRPYNKMLDDVASYHKVKAQMPGAE